MIIGAPSVTVISGSADSPPSPLQQATITTTSHSHENGAIGVFNDFVESVRLFLPDWHALAARYSDSAARLTVGLAGVGQSPMGDHFVQFIISQPPAQTSRALVESITIVSSFTNADFGLALGEQLACDLAGPLESPLRSVNSANPLNSTPLDEPLAEKLAKPGPLALALHCASGECSLRMDDALIGDYTYAQAANLAVTLARSAQHRTDPSTPISIRITHDDCHFSRVLQCAPIDDLDSLSLWFHARSSLIHCDCVNSADQAI